MLREDRILGLDLGTNSLGWALLKCNPETKEITGLIDAGSRVFEAGMDGDISSGKSSTKCKERRDARLVRRNLERHKRRMRKLKNLLQEFNLLPQGDDIEEIIQMLDREARTYMSKLPESSKPEKDILAHTYPYFLRDLASKRKLPPHLLGRAIYHLAQRRGFWSNRKSLVEKKEQGKVDQGIAELSSSMTEARAETLGQYFAFINPLENRIRKRWTSRTMYKNEFAIIVEKNSDLLDEKQIHQLEKAIFFQRKLKSQKSLIGKCTLEDGKRRCSKYRREAQEFRYLQTVNNLNLITNDGELRELTESEKEILKQILSGETEQLKKNGSIAVKKAKKALDLHVKTKFSIEDGGENSFKGDRTTARIMHVLGVDWLNFTKEIQEKLIHDLHSFEGVNPLIKRLSNAYSISTEKAELLAQITLEPEYSNLSLKAIKKLLPSLRKGLTYSEAVKKVYPEAFSSDGIEKEFLPQLYHYTESLRNPIVERSLNELRQVVNAVIRKYGKPGTIRLELARDVKNSKKVKERITKKNHEIEKKRKAAKSKLLTQFPGMAISKNDITKVLLWEESGYICPYTGKGISLTSLFGSSPSFDIEHIIPRSRSLDNSFLNKTLCYHEENRNVKKNRTPYETYHGTDKFDAILTRVTRFKGILMERKLELFKMTPSDVQTKYEDFSSRQLNDTRYASREAAAYLGLLYGGIVGVDGKRRVNVLSGGLTAMVRSFHGFNSILNDGDTKRRDDHRHHTVDAIAIGITTASMVKQLADSVRLQEIKGTTVNYHPGKFKEMKSWPAMLEESKAKIKQIMTSHHISKKIRGALHKDTFYTVNYEHEINKKVENFRHKPIELMKLSMKMVDDIVDDGIKNIVKRKLIELDLGAPQIAFKDEKNLPELVSKDGNSRIPIRKVRVKKSISTFTIGKGNRERNVVNANNHHMVISAVLDKDGNETKWVGEVVSLFEATERLKNREPVINRDVGSGKKFKMSIQRGNILEIEKSGQKILKLVTGIDHDTKIYLVPLNDARQREAMKKDSSLIRKSPDPLRKLSTKKHSINPLGMLRRAND